MCHPQQEKAMNFDYTLDRIISAKGKKGEGNIGVMYEAQIYP